MNNFLLIIAALLVAVFTALFAVPPLIDWNTYRGAFEEEVSRLLDREVRVRGGVSVRLLPVPFISFEQVRIADAPGIPGSFIRAERFKMWLAVPPLLRGVIEARQVELEQPTVRLRTEPDGTSNWARLQIQPDVFTYRPTNVALNAVEITDATIIFESHHGHEISKVGGISGTMTATSLAGPYRFIGSLPLEDDRHELRISTAAPDDDGSVRFNGSLRAPDNAAVHTVNGAISDIFGTARAKARLASQHRPGKAAELGADYDIEAALELDASKFEMNDIVIRFHNDKRQQTLNGHAITSWREGVVTETSLNARWLDLNAIAGMEPDAGPVAVVERLLTRGIEPLGAGVTTVKLAIDQANLAGTSISDLRGRMMRREGVTRIEALRAALPGLSAISVDGFIGKRDGKLQFDGDMVMRSASLVELAEWLRADLSPEASRLLATAFSVKGNVRLRTKSVELSDALVRLADATAEGSLSYTWAGRPALVADIDADKLTLERFGKDLLAPHNVARFLGLPVKQPGGETDAENSLWPATRDLDLTVRLNAREMTDGRRTFQNIRADFGRTANNLKIERLHATWQPGLTIGVEGELTDITNAPSGRLTTTVAVTSPRAAENLIELLNPALDTELPPSLLATHYPLHLAVDARLASGGLERSKTVGKTRIVADGALGPDHVRLVTETRGRLAGWRDQPLKLDFRLTGEDALASLQRLTGKLPGAQPTKARESGAPSATTVPSTVQVALAGTPKDGLRTNARLAGPTVGATFAGTTTLPTESAATTSRAASLHGRLEGRLEVTRFDSRTVASLVKPGIAERIADFDLRGTIDVTQPDRATKLELADFRTGDANVSGTIELAKERPAVSAESNATRPVIRADLAISRLSTNDLVTSLLFGGRTADAGLLSTKTAGNSVWPDDRFDVSHLQDFDSEIRLKIDDLTATGWPDGQSTTTPSEEISLGSAGLLVVTTAGELKVRDISMQVGKAPLTGRLAFTPSRTGLAVRGAVKATKLAMARLAPELGGNEPGRQNRLAGTADLSLDFSGRALSPSGLVSTLKGNGSLALQNAVVPGLSSEPVTALARSVIDGEVQTEELKDRLTALARNGRVELGETTLKLRVADGTVLFPQIIFEDIEGGLRNATTIGLNRMRLDSRWRVTPAPQAMPGAPEKKIPLPSVTVTYVGPIDDLGAIKPMIARGDLERELIVRRMEANVARLEQLRREDEARAAAEAERRRLIEEEQRRAVEAERRRRELELREQQQERQERDRAGERSDAGRQTDGITRVQRRSRTAGFDNTSGPRATDTTTSAKPPAAPPPWPAANSVPIPQPVISATGTTEMDSTRGRRSSPRPTRNDRGPMFNPFDAN